MMRSTGTLQLEDWHEFAVTSRLEIAALLRKICDTKSRILVAVKGQPVTWVTGIDCDAGTLIIDRSLTSGHNDSILRASHIAFETSLDNIRIFFEARQVRAIVHQGEAAFVIDLPGEIIRLQRREFYRVATPMVEPVMVSIPMPKAADGEPIAFSLSDISCGGIGLVDNQLALGASVGRTYTRCLIDLPEIGVITTSLQLRNALTTTLLNNRTNRRLGCQFVDISRIHLAMVQRYVTKRQCEQRGTED
jgi:c-di-GMP-binding flagellar brake protein YcgR